MFDWEEKPELNITPLVDVMLVLLAILMVIAPNIVYEELIRLPKGSAMKEVSKKESIEIALLQDGQIKVNNQSFKMESFVDDFILFSHGFSPESVVRISADDRLNYGEVMNVLTTVKRAGFQNVSLATK